MTMQIIKLLIAMTLQFKIEHLDRNERIAVLTAHLLTRFHHFSTHPSRIYIVSAIP